ncbi:MAG TPA: aminotransferase class I/II-fold pyridoxal phosphate-dependent enzyme [Candidatus Ozemobacteraceae bacterium]|nr:aminotransferase class I/II-fold pyridoxal phosphate-dependent enzyme [Candidatus Ozemobacteraceae bacterium]
MKLRPFELERYFARYEFSTPYLLCSSDCESMTLGTLLAFEPGAGERLSALWLGYTESTGHPDLKQEITRLYESIPSEGVLVHAGAEEAIFTFMQVALEPGDEIIVHTPCYQSLTEIARGIGARVVEWPGDPEAGWELSLDFLERAVTNRTRVVVINAPHNPTGFVPTAEFQQRLSSLSERHGFIVFSDEVYRGLEYGCPRLPAFADLNPRAVSLGVMSKTYGLPGLRIGWLATRNARLLGEIAAFKDYTTICSSAPSEFLATIALRHRDAIAARNIRIIRDNLDQLDGFFAEHRDRFDWRRPVAGPIAFPRLKRGNVDAFCEALVEQAGVLLLPGTLYNKYYNTFRIGFGRANLPEALARLRNFLDSRHPELENMR